MANPAELLHRQFIEWNTATASGSAKDQRNPDGNSWLAHRMAVRHLEDIELLLDEMSAAGRDFPVYRRHIPDWYNAIFCFPKGWTTQGTGHIRPVLIDHLETLSSLLGHYVPTVKENGLDQIRAHADSVRSLLVSDDEIPEELRLHAAEVINHLLWCVDNYSIVGDFRLQDALERLNATLLRVVSTTTQEKREKMWGPVMTNFIWPFTTNIVAAIPSQVLTMWALGTGS